MSGEGLSEVQIYNIGLDLLEEPPATDPADTSRAVVRHFRRNFSHARDMFLVRAPWNWALKRASLAVNSPVPDFGWDYGYTLPSDCLRLLPLTTDGEWEGRPLKYAIESGVILTDAETPLLVRYIRRVEQPGELSPMFNEVLGSFLALRAANFITGKNSYVDRVMAFHNMAWNEAIKVEAAEAGTGERPFDNEWEDARGLGLNW